VPNLFYSNLIDLKRMMAEFDEHEVRHMLVLRMKPGDFLRFTDGDGKIFSGVLTEIDRKKLTSKAKIQGIESYRRRQERSLGLCIPHSRWSRMKFAIEKSVELGADLLITCRMDRSNFEVGERKIKLFVRNVIKQCETPFFPEVLNFNNLAELLDWCDENATTLVHLSKDGVSPRKLLDSVNGGNVVLLAGPEGGFSFNELQKLLERSRGMNLGFRTLRFETALLTALIILSYEMNLLWGFEKIEG